jgi:hypothetical protein
MAGFDAIGSRSDFFSCTGVWNSLVRHVGSSRRCSVKAHGEAVMMRRRAALASAATRSCHLSIVAAPQPLNARSLSARRPPLTPRKDKACSMPAAASSGVKASGGRAKSEGVAHVFGFPTRLRCVDVHVIVSYTVKGSHIQRSPLSMGAQRVSQRRAISKSKKRRDCAGSLCVRCNSASGLTLGGSVPIFEFEDVVLFIYTRER